MFKKLIPLLLLVSGFSAAPFVSSGTLVSSKELGGEFTLSKRVLRYAFDEFRLEAPKELPFRYNIKHFQLIYETTNALGETVKASALVLLRSDLYEKKKKSTAWVGYLHGARIDDTAAPSTIPFDPGALGAAMFFAREGHLVVMPDYLGLGVNDGLQAYLNAKVQSQVSWDALVATKEWAQKVGIPLGDSLFLSGYSQGGFVNLALQRKMQLEGLTLGMPLLGSIPMAGVYDFSFFNEDELDAVNPQLYGFLAFMIVCLADDPRYDIDLFEIIEPVHHPLLKSFLEGEITPFEFGMEASQNDVEFYTPEFFDAIAERDHPVYRAMDDQALINDWAPGTPTVFLAAPDDELIPFRVSRNAYVAFAEKGAPVELIELKVGDGSPIPSVHIEGSLYGMQKAGKIINEFLDGLRP